MDLTVQLVTKNNASTINKCLQSIQPLQARVSIADLGSSDQTVALCEAAGYPVVRLPFMRDVAEARNLLFQRSPTSWHLGIQPWETITQGHAHLPTKKGGYRVLIVQGSSLNRELRLWHRETTHRWTNPVYEFLNGTESGDSELVFYSSGSRDHLGCLTEIDHWIQKQPLLSEPYYYKAYTLLTLGQWEGFLRTVEHYLFLNRTADIPSTMLRYHYAVITLQERGKIRPVLQNLNLCLAFRPLMAEFWCLLGDVYYHRLHRFQFAQEYYQHAIDLGHFRDPQDGWPLDYTKYEQYPQRMIESCQQLLRSQANYSSSSLMTTVT